MFFYFYIFMVFILMSYFVFFYFYFRLFFLLYIQVTQFMRVTGNLVLSLSLTLIVCILWTV